MDLNILKNYPDATKEVAELLGFHKAGVNHVEKKTEVLVRPSESSNLPISNLPIAENPNSHEDGDKVMSEENYAELRKEAESVSQKSNIMLFVLKQVLPYLLLVVVGIFSYYFFFSKLDMSKIFRKEQKVVVNTVKETALQAFEKQNMQEYTSWIQGFYFDVTDASILDPESDNSGNGLSNFQKYLLKLNPKAYSSAGFSMADSEALSKGINPLSGEKLTDEQKIILEKYVDMEVVMNRLALSGVNVAGARTSVKDQAVFVPSDTFKAYNPNGFDSNVVSPNIPVSNPGTGVPNSEFPNARVNNNQSQISNPANPVKTSPKTGTQKTTNQAVNDIGINGLDIDENTPGVLNIPSINVTVPVIFSKSTKNFTKDLQNGVVHYPGTALPGYIGTSYISGHSSNYKWAKGNYNQIFATLNDMPDNTSFSITVTDKNGRKATMHYVVTKRQEYKPTDQAQFANSDKSVVALSTCWPVGSTAKRLVVFGEMTQMDKE